jgi:hypothetical protein
MSFALTFASALVVKFIVRFSSFPSAIRHNTKNHLTQSTRDRRKSAKIYRACVDGNGAGAMNKTQILPIPFFVAKLFSLSWRFGLFLGGS